MEASIWFYTFSTVAQVMAALIGLFAIFVVYKMQDFGDLIESLRKKFVSAISHASSTTEEYPSITYEQALALDDFTLLNHMNKLLAIFNGPNKPSGVTVDHLSDENRDLFETLITTKRSILRQLGVMLTLSLIAIAVSVFALIGTSYLFAHQYAQEFIAVFFMYFVLCLLYMGVGTYKISTK